MLVLALGGFAIGTTEFVAMGLLPEIASGLDITEPIAGHAISAYALGVVVGAPLIGSLAARVPRKTLLIALMATFTIGNAATVLAPGYGVVMVSRFVAGFPHGAYFGLAALVAAHLAGHGQRGKAVGLVWMGLPVANVVGVPVASWLGQNVGWRSAFALVAVLGLVTIGAIWSGVPSLTRMPVTNPLTELGALRRTQVWMTLITGMVSFGGLFAVYTYISTTLTDVSGLPLSLVPLALMVFGFGMITGNLIGGLLADRALMPGLFATITAFAVALGVFVVASHNSYTALVLLFCVSAAGTSIVPGLQTRLMDVAADAQTLAASLNHSALNIANAFGAWIGGVVIAAGYGYTSPAAVGAMLAMAGLVVLAAAVAMERRSVRSAR
ncbi:MFS transporter [Rhodococcus sp. NPDC049939]|uniref:MFS transporter n=1 Tax=Rhodococcus sp. NPDC049939 TaxID=3155511 RepID=UPI00340C2582